jgi:hypothetical protein
MSNGSSDAPNWQNDPFGEDFFLVPYEEETLAHAKQMLRDNRDAIHHYVDILGWETFDYPEIRKFLIRLLWHWDEIDPSWVAEACFMSVRNVCEVAESEPLMAFNCLDCKEELPIRSRQHLIGLHRSLEAFCEDEIEDHLFDLLCKTCIDL